MSSQVTEDEKSLQLAFSIVLHSNLGLLEAQLAALFRPQNAYCIYIDQKAPDSFYQAVTNLIECYKSKFPNAVIFIKENPVPIYWSDFSLLQADLECMQELLFRHEKWKYFINQAGTALPSVRFVLLGFT